LLSPPGQRQRCALCGAPTYKALRGNALVDVDSVRQDDGLPAVPAAQWRCAAHQRYRMRRVVAFACNEQGDALATLACGRVRQTVLRGGWGYTPEAALRAATLEVGKQHRCYACGG